MAIPTLKAGWLLRESSILKRWKRNWFVLYGDGNLAYFKDTSCSEREGNFSLRQSNGIQTALECGVNPPEDRNYGCLLKLTSPSGVSLVIAAFNPDEALAWKLMVEPFIPVRQQAPAPLPAPVPAPGVQVGPNTQVTQYTTYPNCGTTVYQCNSYPRRYRRRANYPVQQNVPVYYYPNYGPVQVQYDPSGRPYYVHPHTQVITVVRDDDPYYYRSGNLMWGMAAGAMVGAALWSPFLFF